MFQNGIFEGSISSMPGHPSDFPLREYYSRIHSTYDRINRLFTFGRDAAWRRKAVIACLESGPENILDICTGTGDFILEVARQIERKGGAVKLTGFDFSGEMLQVARCKLKRLQDHEKVPEVLFMEGDVAKMPFGENTFDAMGITFGVRNLLYGNSKAGRHLEEIRRVLKPGGRLIVLESSKPENLCWRMLNNIYLQFVLPYLGGMISGSLKAYRYLAKSSRDYYTATEMGSILEKAGFRVISTEALFMGSVMLVVAGK